MAGKRLPKKYAADGGEVKPETTITADPRARPPGVKVFSNAGATAQTRYADPSDTDVERHRDIMVYSGMQPDGETAERQDPAMQKEFRRCMDWLAQAKTCQASNRIEMALDDDYYDGHQWSEEDRRVLEDRGQAPLVYNEIKPTIDWIIGTERRARVDFKVYPRTEDDVTGAETKTALLKWTDDINKGNFARSRAFADAVRAGLGWLEDGIRSDPTDEPIFSRCENWRNMWYDHLGQEPDGSDWRFLFRGRYVDEDVAVTYFPKHEAMLHSEASHHDVYTSDDDEYFNTQLYYSRDRMGRPVGIRSYTEDASFALQGRRPRVRLYEGWYRRPSRAKVIKVQDKSYQRYDGMYADQLADNDQANDLIQSGHASIFDCIRMRVWLMLFCESGPLLHISSPYRHDRFPFTPIWCYRAKRDGAPYGVIRQQRDPQDDLNKRFSKAQHILATAQVKMEEGAVVDKEELREEVARPDGIIEHNKGYALEVDRNNQLAEQHIKLALADKMYIRDAGGVTADNLGHETNAESGKAIEARQREGAIVTTEIFDNYRFSIQCQGEKRLSLIEQFIPQEKQFRITGEAGKAEYKTANQVMTDPTTGEVVVLNDITASQADYVVDEADYRQTMRMAMADQLFEMLGKLPPEVGIQLLDVAVDMTDIPKKDYVVARIRKINGQIAPEKEGSPEAKEAEAAQQQAKAEQAALQKRLLTAQVADLESKAKSSIESAKATAIANLIAALQVAAETLAAPHTAPVVDEVLSHAKGELEGDALAAQAPPGAPGMAAPV